MKKFSEPHAGNNASTPALDLPNIPDAGRRPPVLTLDQYFAWNMDEGLDVSAKVQSRSEERCTALFELKR